MFDPTKLDTSMIVGEHASFTSGIEALEEYLVSRLPSGAKYGLGKVSSQQEQQAFDGKHALSLIDAFVNEFVAHVSLFWFLDRYTL